MSVSIILLNILVLPILPGEWLLAVGTGLVGIVLPVATLRALVLRGAFFWGGDCWEEESTLPCEDL